MHRPLSLVLGTFGLLCFATPGVVGGCSSPGNSSDAGEEVGAPLPDAYEEGPNYCDYEKFIKGGGAGSPCSPIAPNDTCFMNCEAGGGCSCVAGPKGTGIWKCEPDPCMPMCAPESDGCVLDGSMFVDTGPLPDSFVPPDAGEGGKKDAPADAPLGDGAGADGPGTGG